MVRMAAFWNKYPTTHLYLAYISFVVTLLLILEIIRG